MPTQTAVFAALLFVASVVIAQPSPPAGQPPLHPPAPPTRAPATTTPPPAAQARQCHNITGSCLQNGSFFCPGDFIVIPGERRCDGAPDCADGTDELLCEYSGRPFDQRPLFEQARLYPLLAPIRDAIARWTNAADGWGFGPRLLRLKLSELLPFAIEHGYDVHERCKGRGSLGATVPTEAEASAVDVHETIPEEHLTLLHFAAALGDIDTIRALPSIVSSQQSAGYMFDYNSFNSHSFGAPSPFFLACSRGQLEAARELYERDRSLPFRTHPPDGGVSPLYAALRNKHYHVVRQLAAWGADVNYCSRDDPPPVLLAIIEGDFDGLRLLHELGATITARMPVTSTTGLHIAAHSGNVEMVAFLLDNAQDSLVRERDRARAAMHAAGVPEEHIFRDVHATPEMLFSRFVDAQTLPEGYTALYLAASRGDVAVVELLLRRGNARADVLSAEKFGPWHAAAFNNHADVLQLVADATWVPIPSHFAALDTAASSTSHNESGGEGSVSLQSSSNAPPPPLPTHAKEFDPFNLTLASGDVTQHTPLHIAAQHGHLESVRALLPDTTVSRSNPRTAARVTMFFWPAADGAIPLVLAVHFNKGTGQVVRAMVDRMDLDYARAYRFQNHSLLELARSQEVFDELKSLGFQ